MLDTILIILLSFFFITCAGPKAKNNSENEVNYGSKANRKISNNLNEIELNLSVVKKVLPNGLTVILMENHHLPIFSYYTFYKVGAVYEQKGITGSAHFLEHLMFKGTKKYPPGSFDKVIEGNGGHNNAYTTLDLTVYHEVLPIKVMDQIIEVEADRMQNLLLEPEAFEKERSVILEERKLRYENSAKGQLFQKMLEEVYVNTPYGGSVIGSVEDLKSVTRDQVYKFFKDYYAPNNAILVVVGDFEAGDVLNSIEKFYGGISASPQVEPTIISRSDPKLFRHQGKYKRDVKIKGEAPEPIFAYAFPSVKIGDRKGFVLDLLGDILAGGESSYLIQKMVKNEAPLLQSVDVSNYSLNKSGTFFISGELLKGKDLNVVKNSLTKYLKSACRDAINEREIIKTKNKYMVSFFKKLETNAGLASFLGAYEVNFNNTDFYKKEFEIIESITPNEVANVCRELFNNINGGLFVSVWNKHAK
ncbi:MAG: pitrilysin family protein [Bacteriovoracaceae bacterium]